MGQAILVTQEKSARSILHSFYLVIREDYHQLLSSTRTIAPTKRNQLKKRSDDSICLLTRGLTYFGNFAASREGIIFGQASGRAAQSDDIAMLMIKYQGSETEIISKE